MARSGSEEENRLSPRLTTDSMGLVGLSGRDHAANRSLPRRRRRLRANGCGNGQRRPRWVFILQASLRLWAASASRKQGMSITFAARSRRLTARSTSESVKVGSPKYGRQGGGRGHAEGRCGQHGSFSCDRGFRKEEGEIVRSCGVGDGGRTVKTLWGRFSRNGPQDRGYEPACRVVAHRQPK